MRPTAAASPILLLFLAAAPVWAQTPAETPTDSSQSRVGLAGDPKQIVILGAEAFDAGQITSALAADLVYQAAARPSGELETLLSVCRQRIYDGYLRAGRLEAAVTVDYDAAADRLVAKIDEGPASVAGDIRVVGVNEIPADELVARLRKPVEPRPWIYLYRNNAALNSLDDAAEPGVWLQGEPAPCDAQSIDALARRVELHLADMGRPFAEFRVRPDFGARPGAVDLLIEIDNEGPVGVLDDVEIKGLTRHSKEQLLEFLGLNPGKPIDAAECERICRELRDSCRFWRFALFVRLSTDPSEAADAPTKPPLIELGLSVVEYDHVPMLGEPLSEADQCLVRAAKWLEGYAASGAEEEIAYRALIKSDADDDQPAIATRGAFSPRHGCIVDGRGEYEGVRFDAALRYTPDHFAVYDWRSGNKFTAQGVSPPLVTLTLAGGEYRQGTGEHPQREFRSRLTFGSAVGSAGHAEARGAMAWEVDIEPVAVVNEAHRKGAACTMVDGALSVKSEFSEMQVEAATGQILEWTYVGDGAEAFLSFRRGEFERLQQDVESRGAELAEMFDAEAPFVSAATFAIKSAMAQPYVRNWPLAEAICRRALASLEVGRNDPIVAAIASKFDVGARRTGKRPKFTIPAHPVKPNGLGHFSDMVRNGPAMADVMLPRGSWAWTLAREASFLAADGLKEGELATSAATTKELKRIIDDPKAGPIGKWGMMRAFQRLVTSEEVLSVVADRMSQSWDGALLEDDLDLLFRGDHGLARLARGAARACDELPESDRRVLVESVPEACRPVLERFFARRAAGATEPPEQSLEAALVEAWNGGLNESLQADLRRLATAAPERSPKR